MTPSIAICLAVAYFAAIYLGVWMERFSWLARGDGQSPHKCGDKFYYIIEEKEFVKIYTKRRLYEDSKSKRTMGN